MMGGICPLGAFVNGIGSNLTMTAIYFAASIGLFSLGIRLLLELIE